MIKVGAFLSFCDAIMKRFSKHHISNTGDIYLSKTDAEGRSVIQFIHLFNKCIQHSIFCIFNVKKTEEKYLKFAFQKKFVWKRSVVVQ